MTDNTGVNDNEPVCAAPSRQADPAVAGSSVAEAISVAFVAESAGDALLRARRLVASASAEAAAVAGNLALHTGSVESFRMAIDLAAIWRVQAQLVSEISTVFGTSGRLAEESAIYCFLRHAAAHFVRDLATEVGERLLGPRTSAKTPTNANTEIEPQGRRSVDSRLLRAFGAAAVAAYAYHDTDRLGQAAIEFFTSASNL